VDSLSELLGLPDGEKIARGLIHTPAEIAQQPGTWLSTFQLFKERQAELAEFLVQAGIGKSSASATTVFLIGAGTSDYIGHALAQLLRKCWGCEVLAVPSTDLLTQMDELIVPGKKYFWISFSRSGDSPEGVAVLERAHQKYPEIRHLVISCNAGGRMIRDHAGQPGVLTVCLNDSVNDRGLAMTSSFSNMLVFGQCVAHTDDAAYEPVLQQLVAAAKSLMPQAAGCAAELGKYLYTKVCFVGSGPLRAIARESALKVMELTAGKVITLSESALGLRHGPMAALDDNTLFVCFLSGDRRVQPYELDLLQEIGKKKLVNSRVIVSGSEFSIDDSFAERHLAPAGTAAVADEYRPAVDVIFGQLLGLFFSLQWNLKPDCPSPNGAISRVVQNVSIHS